jgi:hypothetical protein
MQRAIILLRKQGLYSFGNKKLQVNSFVKASLVLPHSTAGANTQWRGKNLETDPYKMGSEITGEPNGTK